MAVKPFVEHVAVRVADLEWYIEFFTNTMGMEITEDMKDESGKIQQIWIGGVQLQRKEDFNSGATMAESANEQFVPTQRLTHIGIKAEPEEIEPILERVYARPEGMTPFLGRHNWFTLPDGLVVEMVLP